MRCLFPGAYDQAKRLDSRQDLVGCSAQSGAPSVHQSIEAKAPFDFPGETRERFLLQTAVGWVFPWKIPVMPMDDVDIPFLITNVFYVYFSIHPMKIPQHSFLFIHGFWAHPKTAQYCPL